MIEHVEVTAYGRPASEALARAIGRAKGSNSLAPVTVIVPSNFAGLAARRLLGAGLVGTGGIGTGGIGTGRIGIANVAFLTPFRLAELLAADLVLDRRPLTNPVLAAAVRHALAEDPGPYAAVRDHPATEAALAQRFAELSNLSSTASARLTSHGGAWAAEAFAFQAAIASRLVTFHDEATLAQCAAMRPDLSTALAPFGHVIWFLPEPTTAPMCAFIGAVLGATGGAVLVGSTGLDEADGEVWATCQRAGVHRPSTGSIPHPSIPHPSIPHPSITVPTANAIVTVTDADEEVRAVIRLIAAAADNGVRLDRIGVFMATTDPSLAILELQFTAAGIASNGPSRRTLRQTVAGRTVLDALALPAHRWRRDRVMALVSGAPIRHGDHAARPTTWELLSRRAGVIGGMADWHRKLATRAATLGARLEDPAVDPGRIAAMRGELSDLDELRSFLDSLERAVSAVQAAAGWAAKCEATTALLHQLLGPAHTHASWPPNEVDAFDAVETAVTRLSFLDELEPEPAHGVFVRALTAELDVTHGRVGRFGEGVMFGPLAMATGHDFDAVFILGCSEGACPAPRRDDAMVPDSIRALTDGELPDRSRQTSEQHRHFLVALASAPEGNRVLSFPRGDLRRNRRNQPSRWLLDTAAELAGTTIRSSEFDDLSIPEIDAVSSQLGGVIGAVTHGSLIERDLAAVARHVASGGAVEDHPVSALVHRGLAAQRARRSAAFTEWDGNLGDQTIPPTPAGALSASHLETWAACGYRYFLGYLLGLGERDEPERITELGALDRGTAVHEILDEFFRAVIIDGAPGPDDRWSDEDRARLQVIAGRVLDQLETRGRTGRAAHWHAARGDLLATLDDFLTSDEQHRAASRSRPVRVELPFGMDGHHPIAIDVGGRVLSFRGQADRVDRADDGHLLVSDYKTGKGSSFGSLDADPVQGGTTLQLGLYAEAALAELGATSAEAHYWMVNPAIEFRRYGYAWTSERRDRFVSVLATIVDGINAGVFPAVTGEWNSFRSTHENCTYCEFDRLCPASRGEQAAVKVGSPELRRRDGLTNSPV